MDASSSIFVGLLTLRLRRLFSRSGRPIALIKDEWSVNDGALSISIVEGGSTNALLSREGDQKTSGRLYIDTGLRANDYLVDMVDGYNNLEEVEELGNGEGRVLGA